jgi:hypothetical protein
LSENYYFWTNQSFFDHLDWQTGDKIIGYYNNGKADILLNYEVDVVAEDGMQARGGNFRTTSIGNPNQ